MNRRAFSRAVLGLPLASTAHALSLTPPVRRSPSAGLLTFTYTGEEEQVIATEIPLRELAVEVGLCTPQPTMNEFAHILALPSFRVATNVDADQPCPWPTANDLTNLAYHFCLLRRIYDTRLAHPSLLRIGFMGGSGTGRTDGGSVCGLTLISELLSGSSLPIGYSR